MDEPRSYTAFAGHDRLCRGDLAAALRATKAHADAVPDERILLFEDWSGRQVDFDLRGTADEVVARAEPPILPAGRGRPRLGVVSREISLLPRHWEWLELQPQGISAAVRRLVDEARKREPGKERARRARDATSRFMWAMAGDLPDFEDASRALFAGDRPRLSRLIDGWPPAIRRHIDELVDESERFAHETTAAPSHLVDS